jgi:NADH:ubiquinone oxidoreductase subunit 4 (subunit M)
VAVLAGSLLMLALRSTGRRVVAVLVAVIALLALITMPFQRPSSTEVFAELRKHTLTDSYQLQAVGGSLGYAACCLLVLAGALVVLFRAHRWPQRADRFDRRTGTLGPTAAGPDSDPASIWKSIDAGQDPTVDERS